MAKNIWDETLQRTGAPSVGLGQVTEALSATLKQYLETHQVKNLAELIRSLNPEQQRQEAPQVANPYSGVREVVQTVAELTTPQRQAIAEAERQLAEERKQHMDTQMRLVETVKANRAEEAKVELSATQAMMQFLQQAMQANNALMKELVEAKIQAVTQPQARQSEPSSMRELYDKVVTDSLKEYFDRRMHQVQSQPSVLDQARAFRSLYEEMRQLFPQAPVSEQSDRLKESIELERLKMEERVRLREIELKNQREKEQVAARQQILTSIQDMVRQVVTALQGGRLSNGITGSAPPPALEVTCPNCGERFPHPGTPEFSCPRCGLALTAAPPPGSRPPGLPSPGPAASGQSLVEV